MNLHNLYDFDKTIVKKDAIVEFYFYLIRKKFVLFWHFFYTAIMAICYYMKIITVEKFKETLLWPLKFFKNKEQTVDEFAKSFGMKNAHLFYLQQMQGDDVICTASPEFLITAIMKYINQKAIVLVQMFQLFLLNLLMDQITVKVQEKSIE